jgi:hypothetical protein
MLLNAMAQAECEGRESLDEVEKYTNTAHTAASATLNLAAAPPSQHPEAASSVRYLTPTPSVQYAAASPAWAMSDESMHPW